MNAWMELVTCPIHAPFLAGFCDDAFILQVLVITQILYIVALDMFVYSPVSTVQFYPRNRSLLGKDGNLYQVHLS